VRDDREEVSRAAGIRGRKGENLDLIKFPIVADRQDGSSAGTTAGGNLVPNASRNRIRPIGARRCRLERTAEHEGVAATELELDTRTGRSEESPKKASLRC